MGRRKSRKIAYPAGWVDTTTVALLFGVQYQRARDYMLQGKFGEVKFHVDGRTRLVRKSVIDALKAQHTAP